MRYPTDIHKIEREKRQKKREEMREIASLLKIRRNMKSHIPTRPKDLPESRESRPVYYHLDFSWISINYKPKVTISNQL